MSREDGKGLRVTVQAGFLRRYVRYMPCLYACVRAVWFQDTLSNVLFISVEQSLSVYPEDISHWSRCVRNATTFPRAASLHLKLSQLTSAVSEHDDCRMFIINFSCFYTERVNVIKMMFPKKTKKNELDIFTQKKTILLKYLKHLNSDRKIILLELNNNYVRHSN